MKNSSKNLSGVGTGDLKGEVIQIPTAVTNPIARITMANLGILNGNGNFRSAELTFQSIITSCKAGSLLAIMDRSNACAQIPITHVPETAFHKNSFELFLVGKLKHRSGQIRVSG